MTQTKQPRSLAYLSEQGKSPDKTKTETDNKEDNMTLLLSVYDSLNELCDRLSRLNYLLKRKNIVQISNKEGE